MARAVGVLHSSCSLYCSESCPLRLKYLLCVAFWYVGELSRSRLAERSICRRTSSVGIMRLSHSRPWPRTLGLLFVLLHGGALVLLFTFFCFLAPTPIPTTYPYYVIRTQFRRQANSADNKAATVAVDSLLNYEAVKVRTRHSSRVLHILK